MRIIEVFICRLEDFNTPGLVPPADFLDAEELLRFERFKFDQHRYAFLASRKLLKSALAMRLNCSISQLAFNLGPQGKPYLTSEINPQGIEFNLTHSDSWALLAIDSSAIGIDTENMQRKTDILNIARHNFHPLEIDFLTAKAEELQWGFYYWMLKEAYIKYLGAGLSQRLKDFYFTWQECLVFGAETTLPIPAAAVLSWQQDAVAALCFEPGEVEFRLLQLTAQNQWVPLETELLVQTAVG